MPSEPSIDSATLPPEPTVDAVAAATAVPADRAERIARRVATVFGLGFAERAPGTVGSLAAGLVIWLYLALIASRGFAAFMVIPGLALVGVYAAGVWATRRFTAELAEHDPGSVVVDEVAGMLSALVTSQLLAVWLFPIGALIASLVSAARGGGAMLLAPGFGFESAWQQALLLFGLFRCFDILKPWPIRRIDRQLANAHGVMLDDVLAGIFAGLAWALLVYLLADKIPLRG